jgi:hypothetical protein
MRLILTFFVTFRHVSLLFADEDKRTEHNSGQTEHNSCQVDKDADMAQALNRSVNGLRTLRAPSPTAVRDQVYSHDY